jgi:hypothetical protein
LLPKGVRRVPPFPTLCQDTLEKNQLILEQLLAGPSGGPPEVRDWKEWELLTPNQVWRPRRIEQECARTLLADCELHLAVAVKHKDTDEARRWRELMQAVRVEAGLEGPNVPTEQDMEDEVLQRCVERRFDLKRQAYELEQYVDARREGRVERVVETRRKRKEGAVGADGGREEEEGGDGEGDDDEEEEEKEEEEEEGDSSREERAALDNDLAGVLGAGEVRRDALMATAKDIIESRRVEAQAHVKTNSAMRVKDKVEVPKP